MATLEDRLTLAAFNALGGNTRLVWGTYTGSGKSGPNGRNTLTFDGTPIAVIVYECDTSQRWFKALRAQPYTFEANTGGGNLACVWNDNTFQFYHPSGSGASHCSYQLNDLNVTYAYLAILLV